MTDINEAINSLTPDELDVLNSDPQMLADFKNKYAGAQSAAAKPDPNAGYPFEPIAAPAKAFGRGVYNGMFKLGQPSKLEGSIVGENGQPKQPGEQIAEKAGRYAGVGLDIYALKSLAGVIGLPKLISMLGFNPFISGTIESGAIGGVYGTAQGKKAGMSNIDALKQGAKTGVAFAAADAPLNGVAALRGAVSGVPGDLMDAAVNPPQRMADSMYDAGEPKLGKQVLADSDYNGTYSRSAMAKRAKDILAKRESGIGVALDERNAQAQVPTNPPVPNPDVFNPITKKWQPRGLEHNPTQTISQPENPPPFPNMEPKPSGAEPGELVNQPFPRGQAEVPVVALPDKNASTADMPQSYFNPKTQTWEPVSYSGRTNAPPPGRAYEQITPEEIGQFKQKQAIEAERMAMPNPKQGPNVDLTKIISPEQKRAIVEPLVKQYEDYLGADHPKTIALRRLLENDALPLKEGKAAQRVLDDEVLSDYDRPTSDVPIRIEGIKNIANGIRQQVAGHAPEVGNMLESEQRALRVKTSLKPQLSKTHIGSGVRSTLWRGLISNPVTIGAIRGANAVVGEPHPVAYTITDALAKAAASQATSPDEKNKISEYIQRLRNKR